MKKFWSSLFIAALIFSAHPLSAFFTCFDFDDYLEIDTGYRWDKMHNRAQLYGFDIGGAVTTLFTQRVNSYILGGKGRWVFCGDGYVRGFAHYGWIGAGDFRQKADKGTIRGNVWDANIGLGWLIPFAATWGAAPVVGYEYDALDFTAHNVLASRVTTPNTFVNIGNIDCKSTFQGPWVGIDVIFQPDPCFEMTMGWELHRVWWRGRYLLSSGDLGTAFGTTSGFSNRRKQNDVWGNVFYIEAVRSFCYLWRVGLELKYQLYSGQNTGKYSRVSTPVNPLFTHQLITDLEWNSFMATLQIGRRF